MIKEKIEGIPTISIEDIDTILAQTIAATGSGEAEIDEEKKIIYIKSRGGYPVKYNIYQP